MGKFWLILTGLWLGAFIASVQSQDNMLAIHQLTLAVLTFVNYVNAHMAER